MYAVRTRTWAGLAAVLAGAFLAMLDTFVVNVAVPDIRADLHAGYAGAELVIAGYTLTYAAGMVPAGRLGDAYGHRRVFVAGVLGFAVASALCGTAPTVAVLVAGRLVQGAAAALLSPQVLAIIRLTFADAGPRARAFALFGVAVGLASVAGQIVGGAVVAADWWGLGWRPVFLLNVPLGLATAAAAARLVPRGTGTRRVRLDLAGVLLSTAGLGLLLTGLVEAPTAGWTGWPGALLAAGLGVLAVFLAGQSRASAPLLDLRLFADRSFAVGTVAILLFCATMPALYLGYTVLLQDGHRVSALAAGIDFAPLALAFTLASVVAGRLARTGARRTVLLGAALTSAGAMAAAAACLVTGDVAWLVPALVAIGAGTGLFVTPVFNTVLTTVPARQAGVAAGVLSAMQRLGNSLGVAVLTIPFLATVRQFRAAGPKAAYTAGFAALAAAVAATAGTVLALLFLLPADRPATEPPPADRLSVDGPVTRRRGPRRRRPGR
jgi:EmrB/QacA subfamily drug resistance transporter